MPICIGGVWNKHVVCKLVYQTINNTNPHLQKQAHKQSMEYHTIAYEDLLPSTGMVGDKKVVSMCAPLTFSSLMIGIIEKHMLPNLFDCIGTSVPDKTWDNTPLVCVTCSRYVLQSCCTFVFCICITDNTRIVHHTKHFTIARPTKQHGQWLMQRKCVTKSCYQWRHVVKLLRHKIFGWLISSKTWLPPLMATKTQLYCMGGPWREA